MLLIFSTGSSHVHGTASCLAQFFDIPATPDSHFTQWFSDASVKTLSGPNILWISNGLDSLESIHPVFPIGKTSEIFRYPASPNQKDKGYS
jgi:hypothetical protein